MHFNAFSELSDMSEKTRQCSTEISHRTWSVLPFAAESFPTQRLNLDHSALIYHHPYCYVQQIALKGLASSFMRTPYIFMLNFLLNRQGSSLMMKAVGPRHCIRQTYMRMRCKQSKSSSLSDKSSRESHYPADGDEATRPSETTAILLVNELSQSCPAGIEQIKWNDW